MSRKFAVFILTNRRPQAQHTLRMLDRQGYTGEWFLVVDDEDPTLGEYQAVYGERVVVFDKAAAWAITDDGDNSGSKAAVLYARNVIFDIAKAKGCTHFAMFDDDYTGVWLRFDGAGNYLSNAKPKNIGGVFDALLDFLDGAPQVTCVAMSQGGDHIGGAQGLNSKGPSLRRKVMNTFFCRVDRPFKFVAKLNDDVTTYVTLGRKGVVFLSVQQAQCNQVETQRSAGGMTEVYMAAGTYQKSFMSVMYEPSCVRVSSMGSPGNRRADGTIAPGDYRIHHRIEWKNAVPCIIPERYRRT